ncbi:class I SAM-dependent methyltransferase [Mesorhizobium sp. M0138]|uniref:class I SAM-dependent methyltransferase n=1 Tax=Mesorhizobium sp. M0138 TaxID=2956891 RepID=UPI00333CB3E3
MSAIFPATSMPDRDWWTALWPDPAGLLLSLGVAPGMTVLDLCCGDGYFTAPLAKIVDGRVYALDLDPAMIEMARAEAEQEGVSVLKWIIADAGEISRLIPEKLDLVLIANTLHGVPDQPGLIQAVAKTLRLGGVFAIVNWHPVPREQTTVLGHPRGPKTDMRMPPEAVRAVVEPAGFHLITLIDLPPYHYGMTFERA